jgi:hypothetical protein
MNIHNINFNNLDVNSKLRRWNTDRRASTSKARHNGGLFTEIFSISMQIPE